jgi:V/A-type H+-transporting ATPase subunit A
MLQAILAFHQLAVEAVRRGAAAEKLLALPQRESLSRMKEVSEDEIEAYAERIQQEYAAAVRQLAP